MVPGTASGVLIGKSGLVCLPSSAGIWTGGTGNFTFSDADVYAAHSTTSAIRTSLTFDGDADIHFDWTGGGAESVIGFMPTSADGSFTTGSSFAGMAGNGWFLYNNGGSISFRGPSGGATPEASPTHDPTGNACILRRSGGVVSFISDETAIHEWADDSLTPVRVVVAFGNTGAATNWDNFYLCS